MNIVHEIANLIHRVRYPVSMPEEISKDLGLELKNGHIPFNEFIRYLVKSKKTPSKLQRFMLRREAEEVFHKAKRKENFLQNSLFSYYIHDGWLAFKLVFDEKSRLRRLYVSHKDINSDEEGIEIPLEETEDIKK